MSAERPAAPAGAAPPIPCPRCGAEVRGDQGWCVECGLAARTRMAPPPDWRLPAIVAGGIGLAAIVALIIAFAVLTSHNQQVAPAATAPVTPTPTPETAPAVAPPAATPPATTAPPAATAAPPATTTPAPTATTAP
jgi:hypothetical protein